VGGWCTALVNTRVDDTAFELTGDRNGKYVKASRWGDSKGTSLQMDCESGEKFTKIK